MTPTRKAAGAFMLLMASACALTTPPMEVPAPEELDPLGAALTTDPTDVDVALRLAVGRAGQGQLDAARDALLGARERVQDDATLGAVLGMLYHSDDPVEADRWYAVYEELGGSGPLASAVRRRREAVRPHVLRDVVRRRAAAFDASGGWGAPGSDTVAFLPFASGNDDDASLAIAAALLSATDLGAAGFVATDPAVVLALLLEEDVSPSDGFSLSEAARLGGILGAGTVVFGNMLRDDPTRLIWRWTVLSMRDSTVLVRGFEVGGPQAGARGIASHMAIVAAVASADSTSVEDAEAMASDGMMSFEALVAFGLALRLESLGQHQSANDAYRRAVELDPDSPWLSSFLGRSDASVAVGAESFVDAALAAARIRERQSSVAVFRRMPRSASGETLTRIGARERPAQAEIFGFDRLGAGTLFELMFVFPGGGP